MPEDIRVRAMGHLERIPPLTRRKLEVSIDRDLPAVAQQLGYSDLERMLFALGNGDITVQKVVGRVAPPAPPPEGRLVDRCEFQDHQWDGVVAEIRFVEGDPVGQGDLLVVLE